MLCHCPVLLVHYFNVDLNPRCRTCVFVHVCESWVVGGCLHAFLSVAWSLFSSVCVTLRHLRATLGNNHIYIYIYIYIHMHTYVYNSLRLYMHIHTYTYIYTHLHTYVEREIETEKQTVRPHKAFESRYEMFQMFLRAYKVLN